MSEEPRAQEEPKVHEERMTREVPEAPETLEAAKALQVAPRMRKRGRTALLIATAAVLGVVAGTCTGYLIQADRPPTPLPPLSQPVVKQAKGEVQPLSAARDPRVRTDGDLRKLLISRPDGARKTAYQVGNEGWIGLAEYARLQMEPESVFVDQITGQFRRNAVTSWRTTDTHHVEIHLVQFRQEESVGARAQTDGAIMWAEQDSGNRGWPIPGTGDGMAYVAGTPDREPGYLPVYSAQAHAWRGDIAMSIYIYDTKPVPKKEIMGLAERQMGRL
ncbi:hypothetical protein ACFCYB_21965 [Streptomyces sp. NPDC056309]|uniref:hypothetical protein n=1 Tax=unclassified Streptomyces TaxID=2593676 RepID=UPI0035E1C8E0